MNNKYVCNQIIKFINVQVNSRRSDGVVVGLSGGLDSALTIFLAVKALGSNRVFALVLPDSAVTPLGDTKDAIALAEMLKIQYKIIELKQIKKDILKYLPQDKLAGANLLVRLRMSLLYYYAAVMNRLVLGTGDKSEMMLGYFTKYGDGAVDLHPIADLYKTEVRLLAEYLDLPIRIRNKKSSARLWRGQTAERELGISYEDIDIILKHLKNRRHIKDNSLTKNVTRIRQMVEKNDHKQDMPPICRIKRT